MEGKVAEVAAVITTRHREPKFPGVVTPFTEWIIARD